MSDWLEEDSEKFGVISLDNEQSERLHLNPPQMQQFEEFIEQSSTGGSKFWEVSYYTPYFSVDTETVVSRVKRVFSPKLPFEDGERPDLWCPFWAASTLIFLIAAIGSLSSYLETGLFQGGDASKVATAASLVYFVWIFLPIALYCFLSHSGSPLQSVYLLSLYGYSLIPFIPASILCLVPHLYVRWAAFLLGGAYGAFFLVSNIKEDLDLYKASRAVPYGFAVFGHCIITLSGMFYFFNS